MGQTHSSVATIVHTILCQARNQVLWLSLPSMHQPLLAVQADSMQWWRCIVNGEPEIDVQGVEPENSQLSDLGMGYSCNQPTNQSTIFNMYRLRHTVLSSQFLAMGA